MKWQVCRIGLNKQKLNVKKVLMSTIEELKNLNNCTKKKSVIYKKV